MKTRYFQTKRGCLSYITYDEAKREAVLIDPSEELPTEEYMKAIKDNNLSLLYIIETHTHADHVSSARELQEKTGARIVRSEFAPSKTADMYVHDNDKLLLGKETLTVLYTPGHTNESISLYNGTEVFTGDTLLIGGTGRTDFQIGNSDDLYDSIHEKIASLPNDTILRPGHDYKGMNANPLIDELHTNERVSLCRDAFISTMDAHHPPTPELFEIAIKKNSE